MPLHLLSEQYPAIGTGRLSDAIAVPTYYSYLITNLQFSAINM